MTCLVGSIPGVTNIDNNGSKCFTWHEILTNCAENNCLEKEDLLSDLSIQTNPVSDSRQVAFSFITFEDKPIDYSIYSISDQLLAEGSVSSIIGFNCKVIALPAIQKGYYFLVLSNEKTTVFRKFVKI